MCLAIPGKIEKIKPSEDPLFTTAVVQIGGVTQEVNISMIPSVKKGDYILVHVGIGISIIDEEEARKTLKMIQDLS
jgi:hydrogenase expression/formation protein HypC